MTVGIDDGKMYLIDTWPGDPVSGPQPGTGTEWATPSDTEIYPLGTKRRIYSATNKGWSTLMFLKYKKGTAAAVAAKGICAPETTVSQGAAGYGTVTNDGGESLDVGPVAIALGAMTDGQYGWFWVGGVCSVDLVPGLDGVFKSDGSITAGKYMKLVDSNHVNKFTLAARNDVGGYSAFALAADTTS